MKAIVLILAMAPAVFADEYTPVDWFRITSSGGFQIQIGNVSMNIGGCIFWDNATINDTVYDIESSKWQYREGDDSEWVDVPDSERTGAICAFDPSYIDKKGGGQYRPVAEMSIDGEAGKYTTANVLVVPGDSKDEEGESQETDESAGDESAVEAASWGAIKAAQR